MEEEAGPSREGTLSEVQTYCQAMAQNLRLRPKKLRSEKDHITIRQDEKDNPKITMRCWLVGSVNFFGQCCSRRSHQPASQDRKSTRLNSSHRTISYAVFCLKKKKKKII